MKEAAILLPPSQGQRCEAIPLVTECTFAIPRSKTGKLITPVGDGDNYEKAIFDLLQKQGYLEDDRWITTGIWKKRFVPYGEQGYTRIICRADPATIEIEGIVL